VVALALPTIAFGVIYSFWLCGVGAVLLLGGVYGWSLEPSVDPGSAHGHDPEPRPEPEPTDEVDAAPEASVDGEGEDSEDSEGSEAEAEAEGEAVPAGTSASVEGQA
jgi:hypothetical protein